MERGWMGEGAKCRVPDSGGEVRLTTRNDYDLNNGIEMDAKNVFSVVSDFLI